MSDGNPGPRRGECLRAIHAPIRERDESSQVRDTIPRRVMLGTVRTLWSSGRFRAAAAHKHRARPVLSAFRPTLSLVATLRRGGTRTPPNPANCELTTY